MLVDHRLLDVSPPRPIVIGIDIYELREPEHHSITNEVRVANRVLV